MNKELYDTFISGHCRTCEVCRSGKCHFCKSADATLLLEIKSTGCVAACYVCAGVDKQAVAKTFDLRKRHA